MPVYSKSYGLNERAPRRALVALAACAALLAQLACNLPFNVNIQVDPGATAPAATALVPTLTAPAQTFSAGGVTLRPPDGWTAREIAGALVVAQNEADLEASALQGPRLTVRPAPAELVNPAESGGLPPEGVAVAVVEDPALVPVGALEGVAVAFQIGGLIQRSVVVNVDGLRVYELLLEAPAGQWEAAKPAWDAILASVEFAPA
jgi:hypothetical protein